MTLGSGGRTRFDRDTAVVRTGPGWFAGSLDRGWWIRRGPNGGYVAALLLRSAMLELDEAERAPRSLTIHYTAPPEEGDFQVEARVERSGRSLSTVSLRMLQADRLVALGLAALSKAREGPSFGTAHMPEVPPPEACPPFLDDGFEAPIRERYDQRTAFGGSEGLCGGWIRPSEPRLLDAPLAAAIADAWTPTVYHWAPEHMSGRGVPTVDLTVHFRATLPLVDAAPDDFYLVCFRTRHVGDGFLEEDGEIWSPGGTLIAQSRQLAVTL